MGWNASNPAVKRILQELREVQQDDNPDVVAEAVEDDIFEWNFAIRGAWGTDFEGGIYHGRILLPADFPFKPPSFVMLSPSGRFQTNTKICLSISSHHPESWQPSWGVRSALVALSAFMPTPAAGALGGLDCDPQVRREIATAARATPPRVSDPMRAEIVQRLHRRLLDSEEASRRAAGLGPYEAGEEGGVDAAETVETGEEGGAEAAASEDTEGPGDREASAPGRGAEATEQTGLDAPDRARAPPPPPEAPQPPGPARPGHPITEASFGDRSTPPTDGAAGADAAGDDGAAATDRAHSPEPSTPEPSSSLVFPAHVPRGASTARQASSSSSDGSGAIPATPAGEEAGLPRLTALPAPLAGPRSTEPAPDPDGRRGGGDRDVLGGSGRRSTAEASDGADPPTFRPADPPVGGQTTPRPAARDLPAGDPGRHLGEDREREESLAAETRGAGLAQEPRAASEVARPFAWEERGLSMLAAVVAAAIALLLARRLSMDSPAPVDGIYAFRRVPGAEL